MRMFNASLERFEKQFDSVVLVFSPNAYTEVPDHLVTFVYDGLRDRGVFITPSGMSKDAFSAAKRKALINYLGVTLREREVNYLSYHDDQRKRGSTIVSDERFERALRWAKELREILEQEAPIAEELSFLDLERTKNTESLEPVEEEASFEAAETPESFAEVETPKKSRKAKPEGVQA